MHLEILRCAQDDGGVPPSFLEEGVERLPRFIRRLQLRPLVGGEVLDDLRLEERARIPHLLADHAGRDVLAALPQGGGVEEAAVAAGVEVGAAAAAAAEDGDFFRDGKLFDCDGNEVPIVEKDENHEPASALRKKRLEQAH